MMAAVKAEHVELSSELLEEEAELPSDESGDPEESSGESSGGESDREQNGAEDAGSDDGSGGDEAADDEAADDEAADDEAADDEAADGKGDAADESNPNAGWADAMAKILGKKTPQNQPGILVKNKQLDKIKAKEKKERLEARNKLDKKRAWEMMGRVKPNVVADRDMEKTLQKTATRGVVQLFNAVKKHQKTVDEKVKEVGGSERKKAKILSAVSKRDFIDVLRGTDMVARVPVKEKGPDEEDVKPSWGVLREDFMMGAIMRDWDKASDTEDAPAEDSRAAFEDSDTDD